MCKCKVGIVEVFVDGWMGRWIDRGYVVVGRLEGWMVDGWTVECM